MRKLLIISILFCVSVVAQNLESRSDKVKLDIRFAPLDSIPPEITIFSPVPNLIKDLPTYTRDSVIIISGIAKDNIRGSIKILINGSKPDSLSKGKFRSLITLKPNQNNIVIKAIDKQRNINETKVSIFQDMNADLNGPNISLIEPNLKLPIQDDMRGIQSVKTSDSLKFRCRITDPSGIYSISVNDYKIDSLDQNNEFSIVFDKYPDTIIVKSIDHSGNMSAELFALNIKAPVSNTDSLFANAKYSALIIGINDYQDFNLDKLKNPIRDSKNLIDVLTHNYLFSEKDIIFLQNPTYTKIISAFDELVKKLTDKDNLLIFYAGHGRFDEEANQGYWLPNDASFDSRAFWISNATIRDYVRSIKAKHTLLITDACFGGSIFRGTENANMSNISLSKIYNSKSRKALTSGGNESVPDKSVFLEKLISNLEKNTDPFLFTTDLYSKIRAQVLANSETRPKFGYIYGADDELDGDFIFIHR